MSSRRDILRIGTAATLYPLQAQEQNTATFSGGTTQVRLDVLVSNGKGPVDGLRAEDFLVLDEGQAVPISFVGVGDDALNLLLLLDVSGSMKGYLEQIGRRARSILDLLGAEDKVGVMVFSKDTDYFRPFTQDRDRAAHAIDQALRPSQLPAGTAINAALLDAAEAFRTAKNLRGHRAVLILTDNRCLNYQVPDELVLEKLFAQDAVLNAIVTRNAEPPKLVRGSNPDFSFADVFRLSAETGGEVLRTDRADDALEQMLRNMRRRYLLTYPAPPTSASALFRRVQVDLSKDARRRIAKPLIRARSGYYTRS